MKPFLAMSAPSSRSTAPPRARGPLPASNARPAAPPALLATHENTSSPKSAVENGAARSPSSSSDDGADHDRNSTRQRQQFRRPQPPGAGRRKERTAVTSSDLWNRIQRAETRSELSSLICTHDSLLKGRHVSCALERYMKLGGANFDTLWKADPTSVSGQCEQEHGKAKVVALDSEALGALRHHIQQHASSYSARSLSRALLCLSMLKQADERLFQTVDRLTTSRAADFSQESLMSLVKAFCYAQAPSPHLWDELEARALSGPLPLDPGNLCILAGALSSTLDGPKRLLSLVEKEMDSELDDCLVWASSPAARREPQAAQALLRVLRYRVQRGGSTWPAAKLSDAARACLTAGGSTPRLLQELGDLAALRTNEFSRRDLVDMAWILSKFGWPAAEVMQCLEWKLEVCVVDFTAVELVLAAKAIAAARSFAPQAITRVAQEAIRRGPASFTCRELAHLSRACSSAGGAPFELFEIVATYMASDPQDKPVRSLSVVARAVADAGYTSELHFFLSCVATEASRRSDQFCPRGLAEAAHALSKVESRPYDRTFTALGTQAMKQMHLFRPRDMVSLVLALSTAKAQISAQVVKKALQQAVARESQFTTLQLALLHQEGQLALGVDGPDLDDAYGILQERVLSGTEELTPQALEVVAETCAAMGSRSQPMLEAVRLMKYWPG